MAKVTSRVELIEYCLRKLGFPVIEINVDVDQVEDRIDDTFDYFFDYHFDGIQREYYVHQVTQQDIDNGYITVPDSMIFIQRALPFSKADNSFYPMNDPSLSWNFGAMMGAGGTGGGVGHLTTNESAGQSGDLTMTSFYLKMAQVNDMKEMFGGGEMPIRFNRHTDQVHFDMDWAVSTSVDAFIVLEGYASLDPEVYTQVYNDRWVKRYATAQIKRQWGANLIKYNGITLPGGVTLDGDKLFDQAVQEIDALEEEMQTKYEEPVSFFMG